MKRHYREIVILLMLREHIGTTRFNNETYEENLRYKREHELSGCIYALPKKMPLGVRRGDTVYVLEMNIQKGVKRLMGIGRVSNYNYRDQYYRIHDDAGYNRHVYKGHYHIPREQIKDAECLKILEDLLFKGKGHMCRGQGITRIDPKKLKDNKEKIKKFLKDLFTTPNLTTPNLSS